MANATLLWKGSTDGASFSEITAMRFRANNSLATDANNPIVIPDSGTVESFEKLCLTEISANPSENTLDNFFFLVTTVDLGTGLTAYYGFSSNSVSPTSADSGEATTQITTTTVAWPGSSSTTGTGVIGQYVYFQLDVADTASNGQSNSSTFRLRYDES